MYKEKLQRIHFHNYVVFSYILLAQFAIRVWEYFCTKTLHFFSSLSKAGCLRICYSVRPQYWAKKDAISMETDRQPDPSAQSAI